MPTYYKATRSDGVIATRSTTSKAYTRAFVEPSGRSNWATGTNTPPEASKKQGEVVPAIEITAKEYRELKANGASGLARDGERSMCNLCGYAGRDHCGPFDEHPDCDKAPR